MSADRTDCQLVCNLDFTQTGTVQKYAYAAKAIVGSPCQPGQSPSAESGVCVPVLELCGTPPCFQGDYCLTTCTETAEMSVPADAALCAAVTGTALTIDATACLAVLTSSTADAEATQACTHRATSSACRPYSPFGGSPQDCWWPKVITHDGTMCACLLPCFLASLLAHACLLASLLAYLRVCLACETC